jgi:NAD(P)-dependent dehydrogenase (short-subunit alcohol dehydrogenase family)
MSNRLAGKVALVTGGSTGIGFATAQEFVAEGAYVFITGRREKELDGAVRQIGSNVTGVVADASGLSDLDNLFARISKEKGRLDVVFANAGGGSFAPLGSITEEHYTSIFDTNVKGLLFTVQRRYLCCRTALPSF